MIERIHPTDAIARPLWSSQATRTIEQTALTAPHTPRLMERAGASIAALAHAIAPHAQQAWVLCGPGNNGGDGLVAAKHLADSGLQVWVHWLGSTEKCSADTGRAWQQLSLSAAHPLPLSQHPHLQAHDIVIDALLGLGQSHTHSTSNTSLTQLLHASYLCKAHSLAVDIPTGLHTDYGTWLPDFTPPALWSPSSRHTLALLTLKCGQMTGDGRDACGQLWLDDLGCSNYFDTAAPTAWLSTPTARQPRLHSSHKGTFGDVLVIGGGSGMAGAATLAATAALHHGAGRTLLHLLSDQQHTTPPPDVMQPNAAATRSLLPQATVVCGCGGGSEIAAWLPEVLLRAARVVLDADALNAIAHDSALQQAVRLRTTRQQATILTPHPLEAARLLECSTASIQSQRLLAAQALADKLLSTVLLKGSGSIIASGGKTPHINPTGNAHLATGGTGDVLAGLIGAYWCTHGDPHTVASHAAWEHGALANNWPLEHALTASALACAQYPHQAQRASAAQTSF